MRILYWGISPAVNTGYGKATRELAPRLARLGHDVAIYALAGQDGDSAWDGLPVFGHRRRSDLSLLSYYAREWKADCVLAWFDLWNTADAVPEGLPPLLAYTVVDNWPLTPAMRLFLGKAHTIVPATAYARERVLEAKLACTDPIPHGVDTDVYRPMDRQACRERMGIPHDAFVTITVATNSDFRKNLSGMMYAWAEFMRGTRRPAVWLLWTDPIVNSYGGYHLADLWMSLGMPPQGIWMPGSAQYSLGLAERDMAIAYNCADVLFSCSYGEGFCFPIIEAGACGVPCLGADNSVYRELVAPAGQPPRGVLAATRAYIAQPRINGWQAIPGHADMVEALRWCAGHPDKLRRMGERARWSAETCSWERVASQWDATLKEKVSDATRADAIAAH